MVKVGCSTFPFQGFPIDETLVRIRGLGFDRAELVIHQSPRWGHIQPEVVHRDMETVAGILEEAERASGVEFACFNCNMKLHGSSERGEFTAILNLARRLNVKLVGIIPGKGDETVEMNRLKDFMGIARDMDVALTVETFYDSPFIRPSYAVSMLSAVKGLGLTLDTSTLLSRKTPQSEWDVLYPFVRHVHLADTELGKPHQAPFGKGDLDLPLLLSGLRRAGYDGIISIEYIGPVPKGRSSIEPYGEIKRLREILEAELAKEA